MRHIPKHLSRLGLILAAAWLAAPASAAVVNIDCPHNRARHEVTTPLPGGWWNTPIVNRLQSTRVQNIGGRAALICDYGPGVGTIQRYQPAGASCSARAGGFRCVTGAPAPSPSPATYSTGPITLRQTFEADLDRGTVGSRGADIWFQAETSRRKFLVPVNGARFSISGSRNRGFAGCSRASYSARRIPVSGLRVGTYICARTNDGRISEFRINRISGSANTTVRLGYTTWR